MIEKIKKFFILKSIKKDFEKLVLSEYFDEFKIKYISFTSDNIHIKGKGSYGIVEFYSNKNDFYEYIGNDTLYRIYFNRFAYKIYDFMKYIRKELLKNGL